MISAHCQLAVVLLASLAASGVAGADSLTTNPPVTDRYHLDAFGNVLHAAGITPNPYRLHGQHFDPSAKLYYLRARWYDPNTGVFLGRDPAEGIATAPQSLNKYAFTHNNPVVRFDPAGRQTTSPGREFISEAAGQRVAQLAFTSLLEPGATFGVNPRLAGARNMTELYIRAGVLPNTPEMQRIGRLNKGLISSDLFGVVSAGDPRPGDLVFYPDRIVAIYVGEGRVVAYSSARQDLVSVDLNSLSKLARVKPQFFRPYARSQGRVRLFADGKQGAVNATPLGISAVGVYTVQDHSITPQVIFTGR